ncbi:MAG: type II secretion system protein, partial [Halioglobus sp.]|nr:type II secretion system protein [Halioglobus sp.]
MSDLAASTSPVLRQAAARGFTLVEAMVALAILSLLMTTVLAALRAFGATQVALQTVSARTDQMRSVSNFLRESLEATVVNLSDGELGFGARDTDVELESSFFQGNQAGFVWKARVVFGERYGGTFLLRLARDVDARLTLSWQRPTQFPAALTWEGHPVRVLVPDVQVLQ